MMPIKFSTRLFKRTKAFAILVLSMSGIFYSVLASAAEFKLNKTPDVSSMLINFATSMPALMQLITALAYVLGFFFILKGVLGFKEFGEARSASSQNASLKGPLAYFFVGAALVYLPSTVHAGLTSFWTNPTPYAYIPAKADTWTPLYNAVFMVIQLIGTIALIRGLVILTHMGGHHGQPGQFGKAMAHIIGGILCINLYGFLQAIITTLGIGTLQ